MSEQQPKVNPWNVPNFLSGLRIVMAIVLFILFPFGYYWTGMILFIIASLTDFVDGWWARKFNLVTKLGRIIDPFADKLLVCGSYIYLVSVPELQNLKFPCTGDFNWGLLPWMVVVIVLRELLVTMLRSLIEGAGGNFSAKWIGKWKMGLQCVSIPACFLYLICYRSGTVPCWISLLMIVSLWGTVILTLWSGFQYVHKAIIVIGQHHD